MLIGMFQHRFSINIRRLYFLLVRIFATILSIVVSFDTERMHDKMYSRITQNLRWKISERRHSHITRDFDFWKAMHKKHAYLCLLSTIIAVFTNLFMKVPQAKVYGFLTLLDILNTQAINFYFLSIIVIVLSSLLYGNWVLIND